MVKLIWSDFAIDDLKSIHEYISNDSKVYARSVHPKTYRKNRSTRKLSPSGRIVPEFGKETIRELIEGNYRVVYKINPDYIDIVRIHHAAMPLKEI